MNKSVLLLTFISSLIYIVCSDLQCSEFISEFRTFPGYRFDPWKIKKAFVKFISQSDEEILLYSPWNVFKCNYKLADVNIDLGIVFYPDSADNIDGCVPVFVPFADFKPSKPDYFSEPIIISNHSVIFDMEHEKYIVIYTCIVNPASELDETGVFIFIDQKASLWDLKLELNRVSELRNHFLLIVFYFTILI
jgi:hypothetical protein